MKYFPCILTLIAGMWAMPQSAAGNPTEFSLPNLNPFWYVRVGDEVHSTISQKPEEGRGHLKMQPFKAGSNVLKTNLGLVLQTQTKPVVLQTRLDFITRSDATSSAWKRFQRSSDLNDFPLAWRHSERTLRANGKLSWALNETFSLDLEAEYENISAGSLMGKSSSLDTMPFASGRSYFVKPGLEASITPDDKVAVYSLLLKSLDGVSSMDSYKTNDQPKNFGLLYNHNFRDSAIFLNTHAYQYNFIFNDPFKDFNRRGFSVEGSRNFFDERLSVGIHGSYWQDHFQLPMLGLGDCEGLVDDSSRQSMVQCSRTDLGHSLGTSLGYQVWPGTYLSLNYDYHSNHNPKSRMVEIQEHTFLVNLSFSPKSRTDLLPKDFELGREALSAGHGRVESFAR